jgi:hypothetical protein
MTLYLTRLMKMYLQKEIRKTKIFVMGRLEQQRQDKNLLYRHHEPKDPTKKGSFHMYRYSSPHKSQFQQSAVTPLYCCL